MKSIKPGRGPSFMDGIGSVAGVLFGIFWTISAASMGAPPIFPLFGIVFIFLGIAHAVYSFKNATSENRFSTFDITESGEEDDPLNTLFHNKTGRTSGAVSNESNGGNFCPYCGFKKAPDHVFCKQCGKK